MKASVIRTEGANLVESTAELSHNDLLDSLGLRAFDPEEVARNVESQLEKQLGLEPKDLLDEVKRDGRRLKKDDAAPEILERVVKVARQDLARLRNDEYKKREELMIKIKFLEDLLPQPEPTPLVVPKPQSTSQESSALSSSSLRQSAKVDEAKPNEVMQASGKKRGHEETETRSSTRPTKTLPPQSSRSSSAIAASSSGPAASTVATSTTNRSSTNSLVCPVCNEFTATSNRKLNQHLDNCLGQKERKEKHQLRSEEEKDEVEEQDEDEDDILNGEEDESDWRAERRRRNTREAISNRTVAIMDDWDPGYCKRRLRVHKKAYLAWIAAWNEYKDVLDEKQAQEKAEEAYTRVAEETEDHLRLHAFEALSDDDDEEELEGETAADAAPIDHDEDQAGEEPRFDVVPNELQTPQRLWNRLLPHQRETLPWLLRHHKNSNGAILGDEMGLGKTLQAIAFISSLRCTGLLQQPSLVIAPATTLSQWVQEFNQWAPDLRIFVLHESFATSGSKRKRRSSTEFTAPRTGPEVVSRVFDENEADVIITSTHGLINHTTSLLPKRWGYVILDEAHVIRNPDIQITLACKQLQTCHRLALTGAPIQNRLRELWSLFDFVCPHRLGTLPMFEQYFAEPIRIGGLMGATPSQVLGAYAAAKSLRDTVTPFMLRRMKKDVATSLPEKTDRVLFFNLTQAQKEAYRKYLQSDQVNMLLLTARTERKQHTGKVLKGISTLRKICNHPDLLSGKEFQREFQGGYEKELVKQKKKKRSSGRKHDESDDDADEEDFSFEDGGDLDDNSDVDYSKLHLDKMKSSKMLMLEHLLKQWRAEGHKVLVFCQGTRMLSVLETFCVEEMGWPTMRMDGSTAVGKRQVLINRFNKGSLQNTFLFLLTTRVGGVGVNLTGATRVVIFDPDWNPSTDAQARERAWRLGQTKPVKIFRFIISGTIEEKIYHRQIFKTFLTNKVLHDPSQRRFFKESDLRDLFTLREDGENGQGSTETSEMFSLKDHDDDFENGGGDASSGSRKKKRKSKKRKRNTGSDEPETDDSYNEEEEADDDGDTDNALLKSLFKSNELFKEAFDHSRVELASLSQRERVVAERRALEAAKTAQRSFLRELRNVQQQPVNVPTYTGNSRTPPPTAAMLIAGGNIWQSPTSSSSTNGGAAAAGGDDDGSSNVYVVVLRELRGKFLEKGKRGVPTQELMMIGRKHLGKLEDGQAMFRSLLNTIAVRDEKKNRWLMKKEYENPSSRQ